jgi:hypothetical protein
MVKYIRTNSVLLVLGMLSVLATASIKANLPDYSGALPAINPDKLGLMIHYDEPAFGDQDLIGGYCHLYTKFGEFIVSAANMKCFYYNNSLIVALADIYETVEQIKVFNVIDSRFKLTQAYDVSSSDRLTLTDIETVKLNPDQTLLVPIKSPYGKILKVEVYQPILR